MSVLPSQLVMKLKAEIIWVNKREVELRIKQPVRILILFIARTACLSGPGESLPVPFSIIKARNMSTQHALAMPAG